MPSEGVPGHAAILAFVKPGFQFRDQCAALSPGLSGVKFHVADLLSEVVTVLTFLD